MRSSVPSYREVISSPMGSPYIVRTMRASLLASLLAAPCPLAMASTEALQQGIELRQQGQLQQSVELLSQAIEQHPQQLRLQLELAVSYLHMGEFDLAQHWASAVLQAQQVPEQVRANIERFLANVERQRRGLSQSYWLQRAQLFAGHDSNATIGPDDAELEIGELKRESVKSADQFAGLQYDASYLSNRLPTVSRYHLGISLYDKRYQDISRSNLSFANLRAGLQWPLQQWRLHANLAISHIYVGNDALANYGFVTVGGRWQLADQHSVSVMAEANPRRYLQKEDEQRQGTRISQTLQYQFDWGNSDIQAAADWRQANLDGTSESYDESQWSLSYSTPWQWYQQQWQLQWRSAYSQRDYRQRDELYVIKRDDHSWQHRLKLQWQWQKQWQLALSHQYDMRDSNLDIYQYQRQLTQLSLQYRMD